MAGNPARRRKSDLKTGFRTMMADRQKRLGPFFDELRRRGLNELPA